MSGTNQYLPFATGSGANTLSFTTYAASSLVSQGHQPGTALAEIVNTTFRQLSVGVAGVAKFTVDNHPTDADMLDDGSVVNFATKFKASLDALYRNGVDSVDQVRAVPGYRRLPGGVTFQWGIVSFDNVPSDTPGAVGSVTFPTAFNAACAVVMLTTIQDGSGGSAFSNWNASVTAQSATGFSYQVQEWAAVVNEGKFAYLAIGW